MGPNYNLIPDYSEADKSGLPGGTTEVLLSGAAHEPASAEAPPLKTTQTADVTFDADGDASATSNGDAAGETESPVATLKAGANDAPTDRTPGSIGISATTMTTALQINSTTAAGSSTTTTATSSESTSATSTSTKTTKTTTTTTPPVNFVKNGNRYENKNIFVAVQDARLQGIQASLAGLI